MSQIMQLGEVIDGLAPGFDPVMPEQSRLKLYPFPIRCIVIKARPPRHEMFEFMLELGRGNIDKVLYGGKLEGRLTFFMPERHMSVHEEHRFMDLLSKHKDATNLSNVDIITSSPMIIGNFSAEMLRVVTFLGDDVYEGNENVVKGE